MNAPLSQNKASDTESPLDLSAYLNPESEPSVTPEISSDSGALAGQSNLPVEVQIPMAPMERLVDLSSLFPEQRAAAQKLADSIRFDDATSTLNFVDNALQPLALASRRLLADTTVGETGEIGRIAAAVIDGIKILRIEELQEEAREAAPKVTGFLSKLTFLLFPLERTLQHTESARFHFRSASVSSPDQKSLVIMRSSDLAPARLNVRLVSGKDKPELPDERLHWVGSTHCRLAASGSSIPLAASQLSVRRAD